MDVGQVLNGLLVVGIAGCVSGADASDTTCADVCEHFESCVEGDALAADCTSRCEGLNFDESCRTRIEESTCDEFRAGTLEREAACFAPCGANAKRCLPGHKIEVCNDGRQVIMNCSWVCGLSGQNYSGTCGLTFQGIVSTSGEICWCT